MGVKVKYAVKQQSEQAPGEALENQPAAVPCSHQSISDEMTQRHDSGNGLRCSKDSNLSF